MRTTLALQPGLAGRRQRAARPFVEAWAGWLGEPAHRRRLAQDERRSIVQPRARAGRRRADRRGRLLHRLGRLQLQPRPAARPAQGVAAALRRKRHPRRSIAGAAAGMLDLYEEVDREMPLKGRRWVIEPHQRLLAARHRAHRAHGARAHHPHQQLSLQRRWHVHAKRLPPERHDEIVPLTQPARCRREGVARDRQRADLELSCRSRRRSRARAIVTKQRDRAEAGADAHGGAALRDRRRRLPHVRRRQERLA